MKWMLLFCFVSLSSWASPSEDQWTEIHGDGSMSVSQKNDYEKRADKIAQSVLNEDLVPLARKTDTSLGAVIRIGVMNLRKHGFYADAARLEIDFKKFKGFVERAVVSGKRDIGDFEPLSKYLAAAYELLEYKLGYQICYTLRLSDIKSLNYTIPVVFSMCKYPVEEFELHFVHDLKYRGLLPLVSYWTTVVTCTIATYGAGYFFICSPLAMGIEFAMDRWVGPAIAPKLWNMVCTKESP